VVVVQLDMQKPLDKRTRKSYVYHQIIGLVHTKEIEVVQATLASPGDIYSEFGFNKVSIMQGRR